MLSPDRWFTFSPAPCEYLSFGARLRSCCRVTFIVVMVEVPRMLLHNFVFRLSPLH